MTTTLVLGGPGSGKTEYLLSVMERHLEAGIPPNRIALVTYTRAAAADAKRRAAIKFGLQEDDFPYVRTIHSLAFNQLGLSRNDVLGEGHLAELADVTGELLTTASPTTDDGPAKRNADELLTVDHYARTTKVCLEQAHYEHGGALDWFRLLRFSDAYRYYKTDRALLDFTDMLEHYSSSSIQPLSLDVAIVDEAQDLTLTQWDVVHKAFSSTPELWVAGDDDQQIHHWAGAAGEYFAHLPYTRKVLPESHRLPPVIFEMAAKLIQGVGFRYAKDWGPAAHQGHIHWINQFDEVDLHQGTQEPGKLAWLLLARTRAQLSGLVALARQQGVIYTVKGIGSVRPAHLEAIIAYEGLRAGKRVASASAFIALAAAGQCRAVDADRAYTAQELSFDASAIWHDALVAIPLPDREYYLACMRRGGNLAKAPRVRIETIHGSKGLEAENVLLMTDLTYRTHRAWRRDNDSEIRVFYVGLTRASKNLFLMAPQGSYPFPL